jgi:6-phospho-beta-glucosidase
MSNFLKFPKNFWWDGVTTTKWTEEKGNTNKERINFLQEHLEQLYKVIENGANYFGYYMWSIIKNWSWRNAYKNKNGFIAVNLLDQSRKLKKSARWFKKMIKKNGFENFYKRIEKTINLKNIDFMESI